MRPAGERWVRIKELFEAAADLDPSQRAAFLEQECAGDEALRDEVESLLKSDEQTNDFIEQPAFAIPSMASSLAHARTMAGCGLV